MSTPIPTYVICLNKTRSKRCDPTFNAWTHVAKAHNLVVQRLLATTPDDFQLKEVVHPYVYKCIDTNDRKTTDFLGSKVEVACGLSHINAWKKIAISGVPGIVVEDDMAMSPSTLHSKLRHLRNLPKDTHMYLLHYLGIQFKARKMASNFLHVQSYVGNQAYYLTAFAARKLLRYAFPMVFQIDTYASQSAPMLGINIRTRPENRVKLSKAFRDNLLGSTLGNGHFSSSLLACIFTIGVLGLLVIGMIIAWICHGLKQRRNLHECETKT